MTRFWVSVFFSVCLTTISFVSFGQTKPKTEVPNLGGRWLLEAQENAAGALTMQPSTFRVELKIVHSEPEVRISRTRTADGRVETETLVYYTDKRGEKNPGTGLSTRPTEVPKVDISSRTQWKKEKLVVNGYYRQSLAGRFEEVGQRDEWQLMNDGTLIQTTTLRFEDQNLSIQPVPRGRSIAIARPPVKLKKIYRRIGD